MKTESPLSIESEAGFRALFEYATIGILVISKQGYIELANPCVQRMFEYSGNELIGQLVEILIPDALKDKHVTHREGYFEKPRARPMGYGLELYARKKSGEEFPVEISLGHYRLDGENLAVAFITDITQRKRDREARFQLEARFAAAFHSGPVAKSISRLEDGVLVDVNESFLTLFGYSGDEVMGKSMVQLGMFREEEEHRKMIQVLRNQEVGRNWELTVYSKSREPIDVLLSSGIINIDGRGHLLTTLIDITEKKKAEEERWQSEKRFRNMADNTPVMIWMSGTDKLCNWFNKPWLDFVGRPMEKELGNGWTENVHANDFNHCLEIYVNSFDARQPFTMEYRLKRFDGQYRWVLDNGIPLYGSSNSFLGYIGSCVDITEQKAAEENLKKLNVELEERVKERTLELTESLKSEKELSDMKSRFVAMASHEFRTPLSSILSSVVLIDRYKEPEQGEKRQKHVERIKSSVQNLNDILTDFLSLDKLEQGRMEVEVTRIVLKELLEDVLEEISLMLKEGQKIVIHHSGESEIYQDRKILKNVLLNLLSNAVKYSDVEKEIALVTDVASGNVTISVQDHGIGIPDEEQEKLFTKFFRAKNTISIPGTGLGLNIVKRYMEFMNGSISFTSKKNEGSVFIVKFPQYRPG